MQKYLQIFTIFYLTGGVFWCIVLKELERERKQLENNEQKRLEEIK